MSRKLISIGSVLVLTLAAACVNVNATRLSPATYPPVHPDDVVVYESEEEVEGPFRKVALLYVEGETETTNNSQLIRAAKKKAGRMGANAIVIYELREPRFGTRVAGAVLDVPTHRKAEVLAIRVDF